MTSDLPPDSRIIGSAFARLLGAEQIANARRLNQLRLIGAVGFLLLTWLTRVLQHQSMETLPLALMVIYTLMAIAIVVLAGRLQSVARVSRLAIPFLDMPMVFAIQLLNLGNSEAPRAVGNFSLAIFIFLVLLASLSLERWQIVLAAVVAAALQFILHWQAGETLFGMAGGAFLIAGVTALCHFARRRRMEMVWALCEEQLRRERLGRYFSPLVALEIEKVADGISGAQLSEVTVLFSDLRDFTSLAEHMDTSAIVALLNDYFEHMVGVVFEHEGTLDKYIGDGLMVYFGAPAAQGDHASRAVRCAIAMQQSLVTFNAARPDQLPLRMGIGIHTGTAVVGSIGALHRREYTAIGDTVNLAARIEQLCKLHPQDILVSKATRDRAEGAAEFEHVTECTVKGRTEPVVVYSPLMSGPPIPLI